MPSDDGYGRGGRIEAGPVPISLRPSILVLSSSPARWRSDDGYGKTTNQYYLARIPCPLLAEDKTCSVYADRPLSCRALTSRSRNACRIGFEKKDTSRLIPCDSLRMVIYTGVRNGMVEGLAEAGLPSAHYELCQALHIALTEPDAEARWLAGEDVLAPARITSPMKPLPLNPAADRALGGTP